MDDGNIGPLGAETIIYDNINESDIIDPCAPATPLNKNEERPSPFTTVVFISDADELTTADGWKTAEPLLPSFFSEPVSKLPDEEPCQKTQHTHNSKQSRRHRHEAAASSSQSQAESVTSRSDSYCSGWGSSSSCSGVSTASSSNVSASSHAEHRAKSFTGGQQQQQQHRHRLAGSSAARSNSPTNMGQPANKRANLSHSGACATAASASHSCSACGSKQAQHRQRPVSCAGGWGPGLGSGLQVQGKEGSMSSSQSGGSGNGGKLVGRTTYAGGYAAGDVRLLSSSPGGLPMRGLLMAESVAVEDIGKGFLSHWYTSRVLQVYTGAVPADPALLLKQIPQHPGLHLWLVKPPCSRTWVPVRLDAADNLQESLAQCLHADGSCGPPGSKQRVLLDLQCRGFAVQIRWRPLKPSSGTVQQDLLTKLQRFDFALNDTNNNGCRPIELPDGRPVHSYPLVVGHMMRLFEQLFVQPKFV